MRAQYKGHRVAETKAGTFALDTWKPRDPTDFSIDIDFYAGPEGDASADAFMVTVCSPSYFLRSQNGNVFSGENIIFMLRFDYVELEKFLIDRCAATQGDTWDAIAVQLAGLGRWEFDYCFQISN